MAANDRGRRGYVFTDQPVVIGRGAWLEPLRGGAFAFEDFIGDHIAEDSSVLVNQSGTPLTAAAVGTAAGPFSGHGGWLAGKTDDVDAEIDEVALGAKPWMLPTRAGKGVLVGEIGFVVPSALTARQYFFGLTDAETEGTATNGSLNIDGTTNVVDVADDAAGFIMSSLATDADGWYYANANESAVIADAVSSGLTAVVDDYTILRVEIDVAANAYFYGAISGASIPTEVAFIGMLADAVDTAVPYLPLFAAAPTTTTGVEWEIDYLFGATPR